MAKQKIPVVGIVAVVGFMVLILAVGGGFFKNFSTVTNGLYVNIPSTLAVNSYGQQIAIDFTIQNLINTDNYFSVTPYVDGQPFSTYSYSNQPNNAYYIIFASNGQHQLYLHVVDNYDSTIQGDSNIMTAYVGITAPTATPMPQPSPTPTATPYNPNATPTPPPSGSNDLIQQIINWIMSIIQSIQNWLRSIGLG
jgi:hypothetical protein